MGSWCTEYCSSSPDPSVGPETWIRFENGETRAKVMMDTYDGRWEPVRCLFEIPLVCTYMHNIASEC